MSLADRKRQYPDEPWRWNAAWTTGVIVDGNRSNAVVMTIVALVWNALTLPMVISFVRRPPGQAGGVPLAILVIFPVVGAFLVIAAVYHVVRAARFGRSELTLAPFPAHPGEPLNASVRVHASLRDATSVSAKLQCVRRERRNSGKNETVVDTVVWEDDRPAKAIDDAGDTLIRVPFAPPADVLATDDADRRNRILWRCVVRAARPGVDYVSTFELPMFPRRAGDATPPATPFASGVIPPASTGLPIDELAQQRITVRALAGKGFTVEFPAARRVGSTIVWTLVALGLDAVFYFAATPRHGMFKVPWLDPAADAFEWFFRLIFTFGFGIMGLIFTGLAWTMWLLKAVATADRDGLTITRSLLGLSRTRAVRAAEIASIAPKQTMATGDRVYYAIEVTPSAGRPFTFGSGVEGRHVAERLAAAVGAAMR